MEWFRTKKDGIYQFVGCGETEEETIESKYDVTDGKCRELWNLIKEKHPNITGYKSFCAAYRDGKKESDAYFNREIKRYNNYWN